MLLKLLLLILLRLRLLLLLLLLLLFFLVRFVPIGSSLATLAMCACKRRRVRKPIEHRC